VHGTIAIMIAGHIFEKKFKYKFFIKICQWEPSCFMWTDRRTGMTKLEVFAIL